MRAQSDLERYTQLVQRDEVAHSEYDQYVATAKAQSATVAADKSAADSAAKTIEQRRAQLEEQQSRLDQTLKNASSQVAIHEAQIQSRQAAADSSQAHFEQAKTESGLHAYRFAREWNCDPTKRGGGSSHRRRTATIDGCSDR